MTTPICATILRDPRAAPAVLAAVIVEVEADVARRLGLVGEIQRRLEHDFAMQRLGMASNRVTIQSARDQFAVEKVNLEVTQMTLSGLRTIEAASKAQPAGSMERKRDGKVTFDKASGRMVTAEG